MNQVCILGLDIGGSFAKVVYYGQLPENQPTYIIRDTSLDGKYIIDITDNSENIIHFIKIPTDKFINFLEYLKEINDKKLIINDKIGVTGGGSYKYKELLSTIELPFHKQDEIKSLVTGLNYALVHFSNEVFTYGWKDKIANYPDISTQTIYPYLLVNIGSGVSIIKVSSQYSYERITGTSLGGATFWGLAKLLTGITNFQDIEGLSNSGNNRNIDLLVEDIYAGNYDSIGIPGHVIASNFGKVGTNINQILLKQDIIKSLLYMFGDNICQIAYLSIKNDSSIKNLFYTGSFTNIGPVLWKKLSYGTEFWSNGNIEAKFLKHEGYFGAIGAKLLCIDSNCPQN